MHHMQKKWRGACCSRKFPERSTPEFRVTVGITRISGIPVLMGIGARCVARPGLALMKCLMRQI